MAKYAFSNGKVTVEQGMYVPLLRDDKPKRRGVIILACLARQPESIESNSKQEDPHVKH
jgi:hypothetical protein